MLNMRICITLRIIMHVWNKRLFYTDYKFFKCPMSLAVRIFSVSTSILLSFSRMYNILRILSPLSDSLRSTRYYLRFLELFSTKIRHLFTFSSINFYFSLKKLVNEERILGSTRGAGVSFICYRSWEVLALLFSNS